MNVNIKKLTGTAKLPTRGSTSAAGYDLYADIQEAIDVNPHETVMIPTGLAMEIPEGYFATVPARSSVASKRGLRPAQGFPVIDSDYRGQIFIPMHNDSEAVQVIEVAERIAQLVVLPYLSVEFTEVEELDETERGEGGFGSTGKK